MNDTKKKTLNELLNTVSSLSEQLIQLDNNYNNFTVSYNISYFAKRKELRKDLIDSCKELLKRIDHDRN